MFNDAILHARNTVFRHNPPVAANNITTRGSDFLWFVFAVMLLSLLIFLGTTHRRSRASAPSLHYVVIVIMLVTTLSYFCLASNLGATPVLEEWYRGGDRPAPTREIFYVRWIMYFLTFSLQILALLMLVAAAWSTIFFVVATSMFMIVCLLSGALVYSNYKWGFFVFSLLAYIIVVWHVATAGWSGFQRNGTAPAGAGPGLGSHGSYTNNDGVFGSGGHHFLAFYLLGLWALYLICWGVSEAGNVISLDGECIFYGILDILTKPVFCAWLLFSSRGYDGGATAGTGKTSGGGFFRRRKDAPVIPPA